MRRLAPALLAVLATAVLSSPAGALPVQTLTPPVAGMSAQFGYSVAFDGQTLVVGEPFHPSPATGQVHVYERQDGSWTHVARLLPGGVGSVRFGDRVALDGDTIVVADLGTNQTANRAEVFVRPLGGWAGDRTPEATLTPTSGGSNRGFVSVKGSTVVLGATYDLGGSGPAEIWERPAGGWSGTPASVAVLPGVAEDPELSAAGDLIAGDWLTTAPGASAPGSTRVWRRPEGGFTGTPEPVAVLASGVGDRSARVAHDGASIVAQTGNADGSVFVRPAGGWSGTTAPAATLDLPLSNHRFATEGELVLSGDFNLDLASFVPRPASGWQGVLAPTFTRTAPGNTLSGMAAALSGPVAVLGQIGGGAWDGIVEVLDLASTTAVTVPAPDGEDGWHVSAVTVQVTTEDELGLAPRCVLDPATVPATFAALEPAPCAYAGGGTVDGDGVHTVAAAVQTSGVASATFRIDRTPPAIVCGATPDFLVGEAGAVVPATVSDATSGVTATAVSVAADTATAGERTTTVTASDRAGLTATATCPYRVTAVPRPPVPAPPSPAPPVALCDGLQLSILDVSPLGSRVRITGIALARYAGRRVTLRSGTATVGRATVAADGGFVVTVPGPKAAERSGTRYAATIGTQRSRELLLERRLRITSRKATTEGIEVRGRLTGSRPRSLTLLQQLTCSKRRTIGKVAVTRAGTFRVVLGRPAAPEPFALYRLTSPVGSTATFSVPIAVRG